MRTLRPCVGRLSRLEPPWRRSPREGADAPSLATMPELDPPVAFRRAAAPRRTSETKHEGHLSFQQTSLNVVFSLLGIIIDRTCARGPTVTASASRAWPRTPGLGRP